MRFTTPSMRSSEAPPWLDALAPQLSIFRRFCWKFTTVPLAARRRLSTKTPESFSIHWSIVQDPATTPLSASACNSPAVRNAPAATSAAPPSVLEATTAPT